MKALRGISLIALVLGAIVLWLNRGGGASGARVATGGAALVEAAAEPGEAAATRLPDPKALEQRTAIESLETGVEEPARNAGRAPTGWLEIEVQDRRGAPAVWRGARLFMVEGAEQVQRAREEIERWDPGGYARLEALTVAVQVSALGQLMGRGPNDFPVSQEPRLALFATLDSLGGFLELAGGASGPHVLRLDRHAILGVRIVGVGGREVDWVEAELRPRGMGEGMAQGADGVRSWSLSDEAFSELSAANAGRLEVGTVLLGFGPVAVPLDAWTPPGEPLREPLVVELPAHGKLKLSARYANGRMPPENLPIYLVRKGQIKPGAILDQWPSGSMTAGHLQEGEALLRTVPCGVELEVWVGGERSRTVQPDYGPFPFLGPAIDGETAELSVSIPTPGFRIDLRLVGSEGEPWKDSPRDWFGIPGGSWDQNGAFLTLVAEEAEGHVTPEQDGRLRLEYDTEPTQRVATIAFQRTMQPPKPTQSWQLKFTPPLKPGDHDLGDVRALATTTCLTGTVELEEGGPAVRAGVNLWLEDTADATNRRLPGAEKPLGYLQPAALSGKDGSFTVVGPPLSGSLRVQGQASKRLSPTVRVQAGSTDLRLVLRAVGRLRVDRGTGPSPHDLYVVPAGGGFADRELASFTFVHQPNNEDSSEERPKRYEMQVPHGAYDLWWQADEADEPQPVLRGIVVPAGGVSDDERLLPLQAQE